MIDNKYLRDFTAELDFPQEATNELEEVFSALTKDKDSFSAFARLVEKYEAEGLSEEFEFQSELKAVHESSGIDYRSLALLYLIAMTPRLRELYREYGYGDNAFLCSMGDLKSKMIKCKKIYGIWGSFTSDWQIGFFKLKIFGIGRLQFETKKSKYEYTDGIHTLSKGQYIIFVHIPALGRLEHEKCLEAYARAEVFFRKFFSERYADETISFITHSWLIYPANKEILAPESNIAIFMNDFHLFSYVDTTEELWRIFYKEYNDDPDDMPQETSLQRAYIKHLKNGGAVGEGYGVFFFENGKILK